MPKTTISDLVREVGKIGINLAIIVLLSCAVGLAQHAKKEALDSLQIGSPNAEIRIEVFNDYQCGSCARFDKILRKVGRKYPKEMLIIFRNFPLGIPAHKNSYEAAIAVEAAGMQGKFQGMMQLIYLNTSLWGQSEHPEKIFRRFAKRLGLGREKFAVDYNGIVVRARVDRDIARAKLLKLDHTPAVFWNDRLLAVSEADEIEALIKKSIKE